MTTYVPAGKSVMALSAPGTAAEADDLAHDERLAHGVPGG